MNAHEMHAVSPIRALDLANEAFRGKRIVVEAGDDLIEYYRIQSAFFPRGAVFQFTVAWVPYRRDDKRAIIDPAVKSGEEWMTNPAWTKAPEEYVRFISGTHVLLIPVTRPKQ